MAGTAPESRSLPGGWSRSCGQKARGRLKRARAGGNPCPAAGTDTPTAGPSFPSGLGELGPLWKMTDRSRWQEASRKGAGVHSLFVPHQIPWEPRPMCPFPRGPHIGVGSPGAADLSLRRTRMALRARKLLKTLKIRKTLWW